MLKKNKKILLSLAGILTAIASLTIIPNLTFILRLLTYPKNPITSIDWYQPLELIPGKPSTIEQANTTLISQASLNQISDYAQKNNSSALLVLHRGEIVLERYWQGFTPSSTFNSMSLSKTIVALLMGIAIAEGDIKSELEPVANYIPEWSNDKRSKITIQNLLYMQSGLQNQDNTANPLSDLVQMYAGKNADAIALNLTAKQDSQTVFDYNSGNTQILSEVLERATGKKYADYLANKLWQPLGASDAYLWLDRVGGNPKPFCCLFATPRDWAKVGQLWLDRGQVDGKQIVLSSWLEKMLQPSPLESKYGYHIWLEARTPEKTGAYSVNSSEPFLAQDTFYLDGASLQRVYIIPSQELVIVRVGEDAQNWDDSVMVNTLIADLQGKKTK
ncbi:serine hydrolase [Waterburya agarophytonicola K14]|uniref:Serine hydrolase n=1 Tax=Waterburya agarophytonicola KI4 TaxID=2874699 RepID=A0A964BRJ6_9CYAN|nr:serine hydrolase [Waterburya agarophytonicola]MCC0177442.1 serine hydrolase [Waterburya agarophytonicola KI4]